MKTTWLTRHQLSLETDTQWIVGSLAIWLVVSALILAVLDVFTAETYFLSSYIGLLSLMEIYAPAESRPAWWSGLRWAAAVGFLVFVAVMYLQVSALVQT